MIKVKPLRGDVHANMATDNVNLTLSFRSTHPPWIKKIQRSSMTVTKRTHSSLSNSRGVGNSIHGLLYLQVHGCPIYPFLTPPPSFLYRKKRYFYSWVPPPILLLLVHTFPFIIYFNNKWFLRLHNTLSFNPFLTYKSLIYRIRIFEVITSHFQ